MRRIHQTLDNLKNFGATFVIGAEIAHWLRACIEVILNQFNTVNCMF